MHNRVTKMLSLLAIICGASIVGRVIKTITVEPVKNNSSSLEYDTAPIDLISTSTDRLIWFIQVSDLHISKFHDESRITQLKTFCTETVDVIKPSVVLASGDLTDAKSIDHIGSRQYIEEWEIYKNIMEESRITEKTVWLDIRGNHDNFDVPDLKSPNNYYQSYSIQGKDHKRSYVHVIKKDSESVAFIGVDSCLLPGPKRPFNFIGVLNAAELDLLNQLKMIALNSTYTIWFGHYPTSCIISPQPGIRNIMENGIAYMCGHLHTLGGFVHNMYTRQQNGYLELELGDWKHSRLFRVAAFDHGFFSFIDVPFDQWPLILITNPKNTLFILPGKEPVEAIGKSTHVRVLIWSPNNITSAYFKIDNNDWKELYLSQSPLYTASWNPSMYIAGVHTIHVKAVDDHNHEYIVSHEFSINGEQLPFKLSARLILMSNMSVVFQFMFGSIVCLCIIPLAVLRCLHFLTITGKIRRPRIKKSYLFSWLKKLWILASINRIYWLLILTAIYIPFGPWFIGSVIDNHIGIAFAWGIYVNHSYLPGSLTYLYGFFHMFMYHVPLIFVTAQSVSSRYNNIILNKQQPYKIFCSRHVVYCLLIAIQGMFAYFFYLAYGSMAFFLGPLRTWSIFIGMYLWYYSNSLSKELLLPVSKVWENSNNSGSLVPDSLINAADDGLQNIPKET